MLSWSTRVTLQENIQTMTEKLIADNLKKNPLIKVTGDNLDIYVKTSQLSKERRHKDLHLFTSNIIFSRVATVDMSNVAPKVDIAELKCDKIMMPEQSPEKAKLLHATVYCLLESSAKYQLSNKNTDFLRKNGVPVGGDQLTRVRLQEAKNSRTLSISPERRYDDLHPIVIEMWHMKQDLLEKCFRKFFKAELSPGTLNHFKSILHRTDVNGKVKGRFQPHFDLLMAVGEEMVIEQFIEFFQMASKESQPQHNLAVDLPEKSPEEQRDQLMNMVLEFITYYGYGVVDCPKKNENPSSNTRRIVCFPKQDNKQIIIKYASVPNPEPDELYNYSTQLCHWYLHLSELHDTAKEGDLNRTVINCQYSVPFFYSHSKLSKYLVESIDYVLKCKYLLSPLQRIRVLEGSYVNTRGGKGQNVESDLTQEHSVCNQKALIKSLVANKSEKSIRRVTGAADTIAKVCCKFDENVHIKPKSGHHSKPLNDSDQELISKTLRKIRPFHVTPGRKCSGFANISSIPVSVDQIPSMKERLNQIIARLVRRLNVDIEDDDDDDDDV